MSIDTLEIAKRLEGAGFSEAQAEALTHVLRDQRDLDLAQVATKADLSVLRAELTSDLTWRFFGMLLGVTALMNGILFALLRLVH